MTWTWESMTQGSTRLFGPSEEAWFVVDPAGTILELNEAAAGLIGLEPARATGVKCHELLRGHGADGTPICRVDCPYLVDQRRAAPSPVDMLVPAPRGSAQAQDLDLQVHHLAIRGQGRPLVAHLLEDVRIRRRHERIGARLEGLRMGVPAAAGPLTKRELQVLRLVVEGLSSVQIAGELGIQPATARNYVARVLDKLGVSSRSSALLHYLVDPGQPDRPDAGASPAPGPGRRKTVRDGEKRPRPRRGPPPRSS